MLESPKHSLPPPGGAQCHHFLNILSEIFYAYTNTFISSLFSHFYTISAMWLCLLLYLLKLYQRLFAISDQGKLSLLKKEI